MCIFCKILAAPTFFGIPQLAPRRESPPLWVGGGPQALKNQLGAIATQGGGRAVLPHDVRLDDVELDGERPRDRGLSGVVRRLAHVPHTARRCQYLRVRFNCMCKYGKPPPQLEAPPPNCVSVLVPSGRSTRDGISPLRPPPMSDGQTRAELALEHRCRKSFSFWAILLGNFSCGAFR